MASKKAMKSAFESMMFVWGQPLEAVLSRHRSSSSELAVALGALAAGICGPPRTPNLTMCLVWPLWLDPGPDRSVTARNKELCFLLHNMEHFTRPSRFILSLALLGSNPDTQMAPHRAGVQPLPLAGGSPQLGQCRGGQGAGRRDPGTWGA